MGLLLAHSGVVSYSKGLCADPATLITDKGIVPMKTNRWITHHDMRARAVPGKHSRAARHAVPPRLLARRLLATTFLLSLGAGTVATSGYAISQVSAAPAAASASSVINVPWMY